MERSNQCNKSKSQSNDNSNSKLNVLQSHSILFQCKECDRIYKSKTTLQHHSYSHESVKKFACTFANCSRAFINPKRLAEHKQRTHIDFGSGIHTIYKYLCEICGYRTRFAHNLRTHKRTHNGEKPYCCEKCGSCFASLTQLSDHLKSHKDALQIGDVPSPRCSECGFLFSSEKALYHHRMLHLPQKSYICQFCGNAYAQSSGFSQHLRWHRNKNSKFFASKLTIEVLE